MDAENLQQQPVSGGIDLSGAKPLDMSTLRIIQDDDMERFSIQRFTEPSPAERAAALKEQNAARQSAVFSVNGKPVATIGETSGSMFTLTADAMMVPFEAREAFGNGEMSRDAWIDAVEKGLRAKYGAKLTVGRFADGAGPSYGQVNDAMYRNGSTDWESLAASQGASGSGRPAMSLSAMVLEAMQGA